MENFYDRHILPRLLQCACSSKDMTSRRAEIVPLAAGRVLELGAGGGLNFCHYNPAQVESVTGIDPSAKLRAYAKAAPRPTGLRVEVLDARAESLPFADASFDTVLTTFTLCSVPYAALALAEARRVLRPGGRFLFCEHGLSPDPGISAWQRRIEPLWRKISGGCHLTREPGKSIGSFFTMSLLKTGYLSHAPRLGGWTEWGEAIRP